MNNNRPSDVDHRSLQILDELSNNDSLTQRDLSDRLGIALGLVNTYIKNLVKKGYITIRAIPPRRYTYYLTPKGFTEKTRLTYLLLQDYTRIYREAKNNLRKLFHEMQEGGAKKVVFVGSDEVAEIAYITLQETSMELAAVVDGDNTNRRFFGRDIKPLGSLNEIDYDYVIVATYLKRETMYKELLKHGVDKKDIRVIFTI